MAKRVQTQNSSNVSLVKLALMRYCCLGVGADIFYVQVDYPGMGHGQGGSGGAREAVRRTQADEPQQDLRGLLHLQPGEYLRHQEEEVGSQQHVSFILTHNSVL